MTASDATLPWHLQHAMCGTVIAPDADILVAAYQSSLDLQVVRDEALSVSLAQAWGKPELAGLRCVVLGADVLDASTHWLRVLECPGIEPVEPMRQSGWMALEILVRDVHALAQRLAQSSFTVLGEPRPLSVSDSIVAMQVAGPAGEVLYLTEVRAPVPPFRLPVAARLTAERLFIPVLSCPSREDSLRFYEELNASTGLRFTTRVSALNKALQMDPELQRAVGTLQLGGASLIEIDEVPEHAAARAVCAGLPGGLAFISFVVCASCALPAQVHWRTVSGPDGYSSGTALLQGPSGEWIELLPDCAAKQVAVA